MHTLNRVFSVAVAFGLLATAGMNAVADEGMADEAKSSIALAQKSVDTTRDSMTRGVQLLKSFSGDAMLKAEIKEILVTVDENWKLSLESLAMAKQNLELLEGAEDDEVAAKYKLLAQVNASVAVAGSKAAASGLMFIDAAVANREQSLKIIRAATKNAVAAVSQVVECRERVEVLVGK